MPVSRYAETYARWRSGKILRAAMRALADGQSPAIPAAVDDPSASQDIAAALRKEVS